MLLNKTNTEVSLLPPRKIAKRAIIARARMLNRAYTKHVWLVQQDHVSVLVAADCEQDALDATVNSGLFDVFLMSDSDYTEYSDNGWNDSFLYAGNACKPMWCENLHIKMVL